MTFKGLSNENKWVYGIGIVPLDNERAFIVNNVDEINDEHIVWAETVCICSGITDADGIAVFENDIIKLSYNDTENYYIVRYDCGCGQFQLVNSNVRFDILNELKFRFVVVGNTHRDLGLLKFCK